MIKIRSAALVMVIVTLLTISLSHAWTPGTNGGSLSIGTDCELALNNGSLLVGGDISIAVGAALTVGTGSISLTGDWSNSGNFSAGSGVVSLNGTDQSVSGATTFYNLTKNVTEEATLTFQNGSASRTTIANTLKLQGANEQMLSLRSDSAFQWEIDPQGTRTIQYLDVQGSKNVNAADIDAQGATTSDLKTIPLNKTNTHEDDELPPPPPGGWPQPEPFDCPAISNGRLENIPFPSNADCQNYIYQGTLTIGSGVTMEDGAKVTIKATKINMESSFRAKNGAVVKIIAQP